MLWGLCPQRSGDHPQATGERAIDLVSHQQRRILPADTTSHRERPGQVEGPVEESFAITLPLDGILPRDPSLKSMANDHGVTPGKQGFEFVYISERATIATAFGAQPYDIRNTVGECDCEKAGSDRAPKRGPAGEAAAA